MEYPPEDMDYFPMFWQNDRQMPVQPATRPRPQKGEGFPGQRIVVLPRSVVARAEKQKLLSGLIPTDAGYFPKAAGHRRERASGVDQAVFIYCVKGSGWCELAGSHHQIRAGELLVIPPQVPHLYEADKFQPWSICWFHAKGSLLDGFLNELETNCGQPVIRIGDATQVFALFEEILGLMEHGYTTQQLLCASHALAHLMTVLIREHRSGSPKQPTLPQRIVQTITYMKQHLDQSLQLDALAAIANLSRSRYTELFKQQTGYAPIDYFIRLRMHRACQLLDTTQLSIKSIAACLGYPDALYFSRAFKQVNEVAPIEYRRRRKG